MYQIHDLWNGCTVNEMGKPSDCWFQTKEHLLFALQRLVVRPIPGRTINSKANRQLVDNSINMNGNDKSEQFVGFRTWGGARITIPVYENVLRRYMVKDEEGRIVDPRQWRPLGGLCPLSGPTKLSATVSASTPTSPRTTPFFLCSGKTLFPGPVLVAIGIVVSPLVASSSLSFRRKSGEVGTGGWNTPASPRRMSCWALTPSVTAASPV